MGKEANGREEGRGPDRDRERSSTAGERTEGRPVVAVIAFVLSLVAGGLTVFGIAGLLIAQDGKTCPRLFELAGTCLALGFIASPAILAFGAYARSRPYRKLGLANAAVVVCAVAIALPVVLVILVLSGLLGR